MTLHPRLFSCQQFQFNFFPVNGMFCLEARHIRRSENPAQRKLMECHQADYSKVQGWNSALHFTTYYECRTSGVLLHCVCVHCSCWEICSVTGVNHIRCGGWVAVAQQRREESQAPRLPQGDLTFSPWLRESEMLPPRSPFARWSPGFSRIPAYLNGPFVCWIGYVFLIAHWGLYTKSS